MTQDELTTESTVYVIYIACTPEKVWEALTSSEWTSRYFFGRQVESDWKEGSAWILRRADGAADVSGVVRESQPARRLVVSWKVQGLPELADLPQCLVTYEIEEAGEGVIRLTMTEAHPTPIPANLLEGGRRGWPMILSGLKTLLETGKPLALFPPQPPKEC